MVFPTITAKTSLNSWPHIWFFTFFNSLRDGGAVPLDKNKVYISVIPKPNKDSIAVLNYCPISLINWDLKILTKKKKFLACRPYYFFGTVYP